MRLGGMFVVVAEDVTAAGLGPQWCPAVWGCISGRPVRVRGSPEAAAFATALLLRRERHHEASSCRVALDAPGLVAAAPGALAAKPTHERLPIDDEFVDDRIFR
jgi:hypothetical protein